MDNYETLNCGSNYTLKDKHGVNSRVGVDSCKFDSGKCSSTISMREYDGGKPLKYYTRNFYDQDNFKLDRGINFSDGFGIPMCGISTDTQLRYPSLVKANFPQSLPTLPLPTTASYVYGQGDTDIESSLRGNYLRNKKPCQPIVEINGYNRTWSIFEEGLPKPNDCWENYVQADHCLYKGVDSRQFNKIPAMKK
jgi:hypothetical protein